MDDILSIDLDEKPKRRRAPGEAAGTRKENDAYDTDPDLAESCARWIYDHVERGWEPGVSGVDRHTRIKSFCILEPTAGSGPFIRAARKTWPSAKIGACDIRPECRDAMKAAGANAVSICDALTLPNHVVRAADLIITNPPFKLADSLAGHFLSNMHKGAALAFLLNITFLGSEGRWASGNPAEAPGLFTVHPLSYVVPIVPRPSFLTIDGKKTSPKFEAALFVWVKGQGGKDEISPYHALGAIIPTEPIRWKK